MNREPTIWMSVNEQWLNEGINERCLTTTWVRRQLSLFLYVCMSTLSRQKARIAADIDRGPETGETTDKAILYSIQSHRPQQILDPRLMLRQPQQKQSMLMIRLAGWLADREKCL